MEPYFCNLNEKGMLAVGFYIHAESGIGKSEI